MKMDFEVVELKVMVRELLKGLYCKSGFPALLKFIPIPKVIQES